MNHFTITRSLDAPPDRVWKIIGNPGASPGRGVDVRVERPGSADGTGLIRAVKVGPATVHEEITEVGPGHVIRYRMIKGAPVRDYTSGAGLEDHPAAAPLSRGTRSSDRSSPARAGPSHRQCGQSVR